MKHIVITFPNGEVWRIPAQVVAEHRCFRFSKMNFQCVEADDEELIFYLQNDMDWTQVVSQLSQASYTAGYDYAVEFDNARFEVKGE